MLRLRFRGIEMRTVDPELADRVDVKGECLVWTGAKTMSGYGMRKKGGIISYTHRVSCAYANEQEIPKGMFILHSCDNPPCLLPEHLWVGTQEDNMRDMAEKGRANGGRPRKEFCKRGHNLAEVSYTRPDGRRKCRPCEALWAREKRAKQ